MSEQAKVRLHELYGDDSTTLLRLSSVVDRMSREDAADERAWITLLPVSEAQEAEKNLAAIDGAIREGSSADDSWLKGLQGPVRSASTRLASLLLLSQVEAVSKLLADGERQAGLHAETLVAQGKTEKCAQDAAEALKVIEGLRTEAAVGAYAAHFDKAAEGYIEDATKWQQAAVVAAVGLVAVGVFFMLRPPAPGFVDLPGRLLVLAAMFWGLSFAGRNYRAARHNEIRNRHRALTLRTMTLFRDGAYDSSVKDEVLRQAAQAAFSAHDTGFGSSEGDTETNIGQLILERMPLTSKQSR